MRLLLEVSELERAVTFYSELLGTTGQPVRGGRHYFDCGGVIVGLVDVSPAGRAPRPITEYLYFAVPNLDVVYSRAASLSIVARECATTVGHRGSPSLLMMAASIQITGYNSRIVILWNSVIARICLLCSLTCSCP